MTRKIIHCTQYSADTYFVIYKNSDRSYRLVLQATWFSIEKSFAPKTTFQTMYNDLREALGHEYGKQLKPKYNLSNFMAVLKRLDQKQLKLFSA